MEGDGGPGFAPGDWVQIADEPPASSALSRRNEGASIAESFRRRVGEKFRVLGYRRLSGGGVLYQLDGLPDPIAQECLIPSTPRADDAAAVGVSRGSKVAVAGGLCLVVACVLGALQVVRTRSQAARAECANTLRILEGAKEQWAMEEHASTNAVPTWDDLRNYLKRAVWPPPCPNGGQYTLGPVSELPSCSIPDHTRYYRDHRR